jgi:hypothetical protein
MSWCRLLVGGDLAFDYQKGCLGQPKLQLLVKPKLQEHARLIAKTKLRLIVAGLMVGGSFTAPAAHPLRISCSKGFPHARTGITRFSRPQ